MKKNQSLPPLERRAHIHRPSFQCCLPPPLQKPYPGPQALSMLSLLDTPASSPPPISFTHYSGHSGFLTGLAYWPTPASACTCGSTPVWHCVLRPWQGWFHSTGTAPHSTANIPSASLEAEHSGSYPGECALHKSRTCSRH